MSSSPNIFDFINNIDQAQAAAQTAQVVPAAPAASTVQQSMSRLAQQNAEDEDQLHKNQQQLEEAQDADEAAVQKQRAQKQAQEQQLAQQPDDTAKAKATPAPTSTVGNDYVVAQPVSGSEESIPFYEEGTPSVPQTGPAIVHKGEKIIPAEQNPDNPDNAGGSESAGLQPISPSTHHVIAMPDGNTIALPKSLPLDNVNSIAAMYHTFTREVGGAASMLNPVSVAQGIGQGVVNDVKGGHVPLLHSMITEPVTTAAKYYYDYAKGSPEERNRMQSDMLDVAPEAIGQAGGMVIGGKLLEGGGKVVRGAAPVEGAEGPIMPRSQILKNEVGSTTVDAVSNAIKNRPFQAGGEEGVIRGGKGRKGLGGKSDAPISDQLKKTYGTTDNPLEAGFLLPDGKMVKLEGIHDAMVMNAAKQAGVKVSVKAGELSPRESVIQNENAVRTRVRNTPAGKEVVFSIPDQVTEEQAQNMRKAVGALGRDSNLVIEHGKVGGESHSTQFATPRHVQETLEKMHAIKGEPEMNPEPHPFAEMRAQHLKNGGATFSADGKTNLDGTDAWSVGVHPDRTEYVDDKDLTPERFQQFADKNADVLKLPNRALGAWKDEEIGKHVFDVTKLIKDTDEAKAEGAAANQKSIFHLKSHDLADTGGTGENPVPPTKLNASGESQASLEDISRRTGEASRGVQYYDVDSRTMNSKEGWRPLPNNADIDTVKMNPKDGHHVIKVENGEITDYWSGDKATKLPTDEQMRAILAQPEITPRPNLTNVPSASRPNQTPYEKASATTPEYRAGLQAKQISPRTRGDSPTLGRAAISDASANAPTKVGANGETELGYQDKMGLTLSKYENEGLDHEGKTAPDVIEDTIKHYTENLSALWDAIPDSIKKYAQRWYEAAHGLTSEVSRKTGVSHEKVAGVVSVFSPKNDWNNNLGNAERFIQRYQESRGHAWTDEMDDKLTELRNKKGPKGKPQPAEFKKTLDFIRGKRYDEIKATDRFIARDPEKAVAAVQAGKAVWLRLVDETEGSDRTPTYSPDGVVRGSAKHNWGSMVPITKALQILEGDGSPESISEAIGKGHKTRNFYNNIINPWSEDGHLTIDTHAVRAAHLKAFDGHDVAVAHNFGTSNTGVPQPPSNAPVGVKGTYPIHEEAYRNVAKEKGVRPNQAQSVLWEGIQSLLGENPQEHAQAINDIWRQVGDGKLTPEQARQEIINAVGGFKKPEWMSQEEWDADESRAESFNFGGK